MHDDFQNKSARKLPPPEPSTPRRELLLKPQVLARVRVGYSCLWGWMRDGLFPLPIALGPEDGRTTKVAWFADEVEAWVKSRPRRKIGGLAQSRAAQERTPPQRGRKPARVVVRQRDEPTP